MECIAMPRPIAACFQTSSKVYVADTGFDLNQFIAWQLYLQPRAIIVIGGFLVLPSQPSKNAASRPSDTIYSASILQNVCIHVNAKISPWCESNPHKCKKCTLV